jgi:hypothetical protein
METVVIGIAINDPQSKSTLLQETLTAFGCSIRTRLGLNNSDDDSAKGLILLELTGDKKEQSNLLDALKKIEGIEVKKMEFQ